MKIRLCPLFNLQRPFNCIFMSLFLVIATVTKLLNHASASEILLILGAFVAFCVIAFSLFSPKCIEIKNGVLSYTDWVTKTEGVTHSRFSFRVTFTVEAFTEITLRQSPIERLFDVGHLRVRGLTGYQTEKEGNYDYINDRKVHRIYGIPHFKKTRQEIQRHISLRNY